jgi:GNAT superfamily N-acetyltransferase
MQVRKATEADAPAIHVLLRELTAPFLLSPDGAGAEAFLASIGEPALRGFITAPNFDYRVAEADSALAGLVAMRDHTHLFHLFVAPAWQRQGLARDLWQGVRQTALEAGNPGRFTVNGSVNAVPVYERFGFVANGPRVEKNGVVFLPMVWAQAQNADGLQR